MSIQTESLELKKAILKTLAYFEIFNYPLRAFEIWDNLIIKGKKVSLIQVVNVLENMQEVKEEMGFYYLERLVNQNLVKKRLEKIKFADKKFKIALRGARLLRRVPFISLISICNTLSFNFPDKESDIDFFIIVKKNRLWFARLISAIILSLTNLRRTKEKINNKICLSFYAREDYLNFSKIAIKDDIYLKYWIKFLLPVYDQVGAYKNFLHQNNWAMNEFNNQVKQKNCWLRDLYKKSSIKKILENIFSGLLGDVFEKIFKRFQLNKIRKNSQSVFKEKNTNVIVCDKMLKFHENDRRLKYKEAFLDNLKSIILENA